MVMIETQTLNASQVTFNDVHGPQHNYHAQQITIGTAHRQCVLCAIARVDRSL